MLHYICCMGIIRKTKSVEVLLNEFNNSSSAISATKLINKLNSRFNKTTIYRVLDKLEDDGILHSFLGKNGLKWYAKCNNRCSPDYHNDIHPHFQCLDCGKVDCLSFNIKMPEIPNRLIKFSQLLIQGKCEECLT